MKLSPEDALQLECVTFLRTMCPAIFFWHTANENKLISLLPAKRQFFLRKKMAVLGLTPGVPDLILTWPGKNILFIELKAGKNKPTPDQTKFLRRIESLGFAMGWCNSFEGFLRMLRNAGAPMRTGRYGQFEIG